MPRAKKATATAVAATTDMSAILAELKKLTERVAESENQNEVLKRQLKEAQETGAFTDEFGQTVKIIDRAMEGVNSTIHDRPGTLIEKLDIMEKQAKMRREPFDRERTRKILCGEEVEDLSEYICPSCGRSETKWNGHEELFEAHLEWHKSGKQAAYKGARKIRKVDEDDAEATERAELARLSEKYGIEVVKA